MAVIIHVANSTVWDAALTKGYYEHPSLNAEGFIHCSEEWQVAGVLERYFDGQTDLVKLIIDTEKLKSPLVYDWSVAIADSFPHIYGRLNIDAVLEVMPV